jgi:hypothetical protein
MFNIRSYWKNLRELVSDLNLVDYLALLLTITGVNATVIVQTYIPQIKIPFYVGILVSLVLVFFIVAFFGGKRGTRTHHLFDEGSQEEADFFNEWYRKPGKLIMFCSDLKWIRKDNYVKVRDALAKKGSELDLYLKDPKGDFVKSLQSYGAKLHIVRPDIRSVHKFSILQDDDFQAIIIRNKEDESDKIKVEEYNKNLALINVSLDMLDDCEIIPKGKHPKNKKGK